VGAGTADTVEELTPDAPEDALVDRVAAAALSVPGVHDLHGGVLGEVATYLPGRRVAGVRLHDDSTSIHLVLRWDAPMSDTVDEVRTRVGAVVPGVVHLTVEDVVGPADVAGETPSDVLAD
jgi:hypothetical protein